MSNSGAEDPGVPAGQPGSGVRGPRSSNVSLRARHQSRSARSVPFVSDGWIRRTLELCRRTLRRRSETAEESETAASAFA